MNAALQKTKKDTGGCLIQIATVRLWLWHNNSTATPEGVEFRLC